MELLKHAPVRVAIVAVATMFVAPKINSLLNWTVPEDVAGEPVGAAAARNKLQDAGLQFALAGMGYVLLTMAAQGWG